MKIAPPIIIQFTLIQFCIAARITGYITISNVLNIVCVLIPDYL